MRIVSILFVLLFGCTSSHQGSLPPSELSPQVIAIFPSADTLPENLLRMHLQFSKPMKTTGNLEHLKLLDEVGQEVEGAIFNNVYELWDKEQKCLTIIFDPSRVKTGLKAHNKMGRALSAGKKYTLTVDKLTDANWIPLEKAFTKSFFVGAADLEAPDAKKWDIHLPEANSKSPIRIHFPTMLDRLSLVQSLRVTDLNNQPITGRVTIKNRESSWHFTPTKKWTAGDYLLYVNTRLEDPTGNNLNGLFDHKVGTLKYQHEGQIERIPLKIKAKSR